MSHGAASHDDRIESLACQPKRCQIINEDTAKSIGPYERINQLKLA